MKKKISIVIIILLFISVVSLLIYNLTKKEEYKEIEKEGTIDNYSYKIDTMIEYNNFYKEKRGYVIDTLNQPNSPYYYIITMGERPTGGYSISINSIEVDSNDHMKVIVNEINPELGSITTQALTYPTTSLELDHSPKKITIENTNGMKFKCLNC